MSRDKGMITTTASTSGRPLTLDPIVEREPLPFPVRRVESSMPCGFRQEWVSGEFEDNGTWTFHLTSGAGVGSPYMTLGITDPGGLTTEEIVDMREVLPAWIEAARAVQSPSGLS